MMLPSLLSASLLCVGAVAAFTPLPQPSSTTLLGLRVPSRSRSTTAVPADDFQTSRVCPSFLGKPRASRTPLAAAAAADATANPVKLIIAGAPASGKGTQCEIIQAKYGVVHLSTGDMLRAAVAAGTDVGRQAKDFMDSGKLVPDEVIIGVVKDRLAEKDCQELGWLLDGFPRTQAQAQALEEAGVAADCFIFLNVPDEVLVERVVGRRTDPDTGKIYHMTFSPPTDEAIVARLEQRSDDTEEKVVVRLEQFHANVDAVKDSYTDISVTMDGNQAPADVSKAIMEAVEAKLASKATA